MSDLPQKCIVDTNVPKTANHALSQANIPQELFGCILSCVEAVEHIVKKGRLVIDAGDDIFGEYRQHLSMKGQPGVGDRFMKWVHDNRWNPEKVERIEITKNSDSYDEFPTHIGLVDFDNSDRKFIAVSNAHPHKPPVLQATDSKWWGWKEALADVGISVHFLCPDYAKKKYSEKMGL